LTDGNCVMKFIYQKQEFLIPIYVLLKALAPQSASSDGATDVMIYNRLVKGSGKNS
jgi:DNA-directed RNA polymerase I subunit RPA2